MIASSREMVEELGITQRLLEADVFAGRIELLEGDAAAAERALRGAYEGLRDLGLGIDAARAAALLGRALLAQGRAAEAEALSHESEALAGDDLKAAIAWRGVRAEALARRGEHAAAIELASAAVAIAAATDALLDHADARLALAAALRAAGRGGEADAEERRAIELWEAKGATLLAERARREPRACRRRPSAHGATDVGRDADRRCAAACGRTRRPRRWPASTAAFAARDRRCGRGARSRGLSRDRSPDGIGVGRRRGRSRRSSACSDRAIHSTTAEPLATLGDVWCSSGVAPASSGDRAAGATSALRERGDLARRGRRARPDALRTKSSPPIASATPSRVCTSATPSCCPTDPSARRAAGIARSIARVRRPDRSRSPGDGAGSHPVESWIIGSWAPGPRETRGVPDALAACSASSRRISRTDSRMCSPARPMRSWLA